MISQDLSPRNAEPVSLHRAGSVGTGVNEISEVGAAARTCLRRHPRKGEGLAGCYCGRATGRGVDSASRVAYLLTFENNQLGRLLRRRQRLLQPP